MNSEQTPPTASDHAVVMLRVSVTPHDIAEGVGRSCSACPIALAITRTLREHLKTMDFVVEFVPYAAFVEPRGLEVLSWSRRDVLAHIPAYELPDALEEFAMDFDDWEDFECMNDCERIEWNRERGNDDDYEPWKPQPFDFEIELTLAT